MAAKTGKRFEVISSRFALGGDSKKHKPKKTIHGNTCQFSAGLNHRNPQKPRSNFHAKAPRRFQAPEAQAPSAQGGKAGAEAQARRRLAAAKKGTTIQKGVYVYIHIYIYACMYACMHACMCVCMYVCMYACMHACMYVCMYV